MVEELVRLIHSDEFIEKVADLAMEYQEKEKDDSALKALEAHQKETEKKIDNMMKAIEDGIVTTSTKTRLMQLEAELADVERGIAKELIKTPELDRDQIVFFLQRFRDGDIKDEEYRTFLVDTFLQAVYVYDDRLVITLNYSGENNTVTKKIADKAANGKAYECSCFAPSGALNGANLNTPTTIRIFWIQRVIGVVAPYDRKIQKQRKKARV